MWIGASKIYSDLTMEEQHVYLRHFYRITSEKARKYREHKLTYVPIMLLRGG